jgi:outer membrane protein insertion porin family
LGYTKRNAYAANLASYNTNVANAGINFGIPLNEFDRIGFDIDLKSTGVESTGISSDQVRNKILAYNNQQPCYTTRDSAGKLTNDCSGISASSTFTTLSTSAGWTHDTLDRATFSTKGGQQRLSGLITVPFGDLQYYKVGYKHQHFFPLSNDFTFRLLGEVAHGGGYGSTSELPFFENYYAGGTGDVRGFMQNTLGPRDDTKGGSTYYRPFGGSTKIIGKAELFFPVPFLSEMKSVRVGTFLDAGTLADGFNNIEIDGKKVSALRHYFRYSAGLSGEWLSPFGALAVSVAQPLNSESTDRTQAFQFTFGSGF